MSGERCSKPRVLAARLLIAAGVLLLALAIMAAAPNSASSVDGGLRLEPEAFKIPAFARMYKTGCSTCHTAAPKLNVLGEAFRLNGYRFPENDKLLRRDKPVPLGSPPWKDQWPRAIWPGELPGTVPLAVRVASDIRVREDPEDGHLVSLRFPDEIYLLAASPLGENIGVFLETEWNRDEGIEILQGKLKFQNLIPGLPKRGLNLWVGLQNLYLFTFADRQIDRDARLKFIWQEYRVSDIELVDPIVSDSIVSAGGFSLGRTRPAIELNGLIKGRLYYGAGVAQEIGNLTEEEFGRIDGYYKLRYKFGGLGLDGRYAPGVEPVLGGGGQLLDRSLILETFGYFGSQPVEGAIDEHRSFGFNGRGLYGPLDVGVGYVWGRNNNPALGRGRSVQEPLCEGRVPLLPVAYRLAEVRHLRLGRARIGSRIRLRRGWVGCDTRHARRRLPYPPEHSRRHRGRAVHSVGISKRSRRLQPQEHLVPAGRRLLAKFSIIRVGC
jgi:hypothetical protein